MYTMLETASKMYETLFVYSKWIIENWDNFGTDFAM